MYIKTQTYKRLIMSGILVGYTYLSWLMIKICLSYFPWQSDFGFLSLKQDVVLTQPWQAAFKIHVIFSCILLITGFSQFFLTLRIKFPKLHRVSGWIYVLTILFFALPSGFILALSAAGGFITQTCFILLCLIWGLSTVMAVYKAITRQWHAHRAWMIRSFALSCSALSLRSWKILLYHIQPYFEWLSPIHIYQIEAWLGWVVNLFIAEWIIYRLARNSFKKI